MLNFIHPLKNAYTVELKRCGNNRGFFTRVLYQNEFKHAGLVTIRRHRGKELCAQAPGILAMHGHHAG